MKNAKLGSKVLAIVLSLLMALPTIGFATPTLSATKLVVEKIDISEVVSTETTHTRDAAIYGNYLYVHTRENALKVYNITNPEAPELVYTMGETLYGQGITDAIYTIDICEDTLFVTFLDSGNANNAVVRSFDLTNPAEPTLKATFASFWKNTAAIEVLSDGTLYCSYANGWKAYANAHEATGTVTPTSTISSGKFRVYESESGKGAFRYRENTTISGTTGSGEKSIAYRAFATTGDYIYVLRDNALDVVNVSSSAFTTAYDSKTTVDLTSLNFDETSVGERGVVANNHLFFFSANGILTFDVTNPASPVNVANTLAGATMQNAATYGNYFYTVNIGTVNLYKTSMATLTITSGASVTSTPIEIEGICSGGDKVTISLQSAEMPEAFVDEATISNGTWTYELDDIYDGTYDLEVKLYDGNNALLTLEQEINVTGVAGTSGVPASSNTSANTPDAAQLQIRTANLASSGSDKIATVTGVVPMGDRIGYKEVTLTVTDETETYTYYEGTQKCFGNFVFDAVTLDETSDTIAEGDTVKFIVQSEDGDDDERSSVYYSDAYLNEAYAAISGKADIADIEDAIDTYNDVYQLDVEGDFAGLSSPEEVLGALLGKTYTKDAPMDLVNDFDEAVQTQVEIEIILLEIKDAATDALAIQVLENETDGAAKQALLGINLEANTAYGKLKTSAKESLYNDIRGIEQLKRADVVRILSLDNCILLLVNTSADTDLEDALLDYKTELQIDPAKVTKYNDGETAEKNNVLRAVTRINEDEYFDTLIEAGNAFEAAVGQYVSDGGGGGGLSTKDPGPSDDEDLKGDDVPITSIKGNTETPDVAIKSVFSDIKEAAWAEKYIMYLYSNQIVNGKSKDKFAPNDNITREEFVKIIVMAIGEKGEMGETEFTDVDSSAWYAPYLNTAIRLGIIKGVDEDTFGIGSEITREQMAVIIHRAAAVKNKKFSTTTEKTFADSVADYADEAVKALSGAGIINGYEDGTFRGNKTATRAESAKIIYGYLMMK